MLVMVVVGINSALVMVALVLNRTACRRPGLRDDNYRRRQITEAFLLNATASLVSFGCFGINSLPVS